MVNTEFKIVVSWGREGAWHEKMRLRRDLHGKG